MWCRCASLLLLTCNLKHFEPLGVACADPLIALPGVSQIKPALSPAPRLRPQGTHDASTEEAKNMSVQTYSSHDFRRNVSAAKRAAQKGPAFIADCGQPAFVLLKIEDYWHLAGQREESLLDVMDAIPGVSPGGPTSGLAGEIVCDGGIEFKPPPLQVKFRSAKFA